MTEPKSQEHQRQAECPAREDCPGSRPPGGCGCHTGLSSDCPKAMSNRTCKGVLIWKADLCRWDYVEDLKMRSSCLRMDSKSDDKCPWKRRGGGRMHRRQRQTLGRGFCEPGSTTTAASTGTARHAADSPSQPPEESNPVDALASDFWQPELESAFLLLSAPQSVVICFSRN